MSITSKTDRAKVSNSRIITTLAGLLFSGVFIYFSLRGIDFSTLWAGLKKADYVFVLAAAVAFIVLMWSRSWRWGGILDPIRKVGQKTLFPITCVGYMAIAILPFRLGELIRPVLINRRIPDVPLMSGISSVIVERIFDALILTTILLSSFVILPLPQWLVISAVIILAICLVLLIAMIVIAFNTDKAIKLMSPLFRILPEKLSRRVIDLIRDLSNGFKAITNPRRFVFITLQTLVVWIVGAIAVFLLFQSLKLDLPLAAIIVVISFNGLGVMLPSAPGFVGNFEYSVILALSLFNIPKENALVFAIIYHVLGIGINILLGLAFLPLTRFSLKSLKPVQNQS
jgi:glycosyltransferase 2 family protein